MSHGRTSPYGPLVPGRNCWTVGHADRFSVLQDGEVYFRLLRDAVLRAERTVFVLSWDINAGTELTPNQPPGAVPSRLDRFLHYAARRKPQVHIFILTWDYGLLFTLERDPFTRWRLGWRMPRNVHLDFDDHHPVGACHHQKIVVVDDTLAFSGSMDPTGHRWDTTAHRLDDPARLDPLGRPYDPYHEVQAMLEGPAAAELGVLARDRWRAIGVTTLPSASEPGPSLWPSDLAPDFTDTGVAIARTLPGGPSRPAVRECEALYFDAIARARHSIYIENQYFTHPGMAQALAARLGERDGPEIVLAVPRGGDGWLDRNTIQIMRNELFRMLVAADAHGRLRLVYPMASRRRDVSTFIHSKVLVVDDELVLVGSANTNRRSMGMDTECDVAVAPESAAGRAAVTAIRDRLVAEHLGLSPTAAAAAIRDAGSVARAIDAHQQADHTLVLFDAADFVTAPLDDTVRYAVDPDEPPSLGPDADWLAPVASGPTARVPLRVWISPVVALLAAAAVVWTPPRLFGAPAIEVAEGTAALGDPQVMTAIVLVSAGMVLLPIEPLLVATGVVAGWQTGTVVAVIATFFSAIAGYLAGWALGEPAITRWVSPKTRRSIRQLGHKGVRGMAVLRLSGLASAGAVHLVAGSARVPFGSFLIGTAAGLLPAVVALTALGALLGRTLAAPSISNALATAGAALVLLVCALALRTFLVIRQFAPARSRHQARAEFG